MDAEHRHELKQNDLVEWIIHFPEYARENYMQLIGAALVVLGLISWFLWPSVKGSMNNSNLDKQAKVTQVLEQVPGSRSASMRSGMGSLPDAFLMTANNLETEASQTGDPIAKSLLLIKRGESLRSDLHYSSGTQDAAIIASQMQQATAAYDAAIASATGQPEGASLVAMATYGLGLCAEELGNFAKAEGIYKSIVANAEFEGTVFPVQAEKRIVSLADNKGAVVFTKAPVVAPIEIPMLESDAPAEMPFLDILETEAK
jgi:hypothetical protein